MTDLSCKLLVIGAGPGGYVCAIRAGQLGIDTIVVEAEKAGGTCLNVGCIPSKALIHAADEFHKIAACSSDNPLGISTASPEIDFAQTIGWKDGIVKRLNTGVAGLIKKSGGRVVQGTARFLNGKTVSVATSEGDIRIKAENIVIATGSAPVELPFLPFGGSVISSTEALALTEIPAALVVVGGGYIGLEIGTAYAKLGAKVTIVEAEARILSQYDSALTRPVMKRLAELGVDVRTDCKAKGLSADGAALEVLDKDGATHVLPADKILVTVGRRPRTDGAGIEELALTMDGAFIRVDNKCRTSMSGVFAIGDVTGEPMLAHRAMAMGEMVAEIVAGHKRVWDKTCIPAVCFTDPEIVTCGLSSDEAKARHGDVLSAQFPFQANGRALTTEREDGFIRVIAHPSSHVILGIQAVGVGISELSSAFSIALEMGARLEDISATIHAHPTQSEGLQEACLAALGHALHI